MNLHEIKPMRKSHMWDHTFWTSVITLDLFGLIYVNG